MRRRRSAPERKHVEHSYASRAFAAPGRAAVLSAAKPRRDCARKGGPVRPTMFIGSSTEALPVAEAVHSLLESKGVESTLWNNGAFGLNTSGLESLMRASERFDYACFILHKDDLARPRGKKLFTVRDNVILEIGLLLGALGRDRVFIIFERGNKPDLPSDLNGITFLSYDGSRADGNLKSALVTACLEIQDVVKRLGRRDGERGAPAAFAPDAPFRVS